MGKRRSKLTDNLVKVYKSKCTAETDGVSDEIDLELPRGYVAKIKESVIGFGNLSNVATDNLNCRAFGALVRDPDDTTSYEIPEHSVQHDVMHDFDGVIQFQTDGLFTIYPANPDRKRFDQEEDFITARNMRFNADFTTETDAVTLENTIYYTLEKVTKDEILELLDIL